MPPVETILAENEKLKERLSRREARIAELEKQIAWFRRQLFAGGKSDVARQRVDGVALKG